MLILSLIFLSLSKTNLNEILIPSLQINILDYEKNSMIIKNNNDKINTSILSKIHITNQLEIDFLKNIFLKYRKTLRTKLNTVEIPDIFLSKSVRKNTFYNEYDKFFNKIVFLFDFIHTKYSNKLLDLTNFYERSIIDIFKLDRLNKKDFQILRNIMIKMSMFMFMMNDKILLMVQSNVNELFEFLTQSKNIDLVNVTLYSGNNITIIKEIDIFYDQIKAIFNENTGILTDKILKSRIIIIESNNNIIKYSSYKLISNHFNKILVNLINFKNLY